MDICVQFKALADPARVKILRLLKRRPLCVNAIVRKIGLSQPAVSHHLRVLREAGLVQATKKGTTVHYVTNKHAIVCVCGCVEEEFKA